MILTATVHGAVSLFFAVAVCVAVVTVPSGLPREVAPTLLACYTALTIAVMLTGVLASARVVTQRAARGPQAPGATMSTASRRSGKLTTTVRQSKAESTRS